MKVLCSACEAAEARVLCCADEAALCARCDRGVHAANPLAGKHHRLPLLSPASAATTVSAPKCDICQECHAYFFCVEDRALLCRSCDVAVHTANAFVSAHRRFLLTGVQVGLEPDDQEPEPTQPPNASAAPPLQPPPCPKKSSPTPLYSDDDIDWACGPDVGITGNLPDWSVVDEQFSSLVLRPAELMVSKTPPKSAAVFGGLGGVAGSMPDWPLDEFFGFAEFNAGFRFTENGTSKTDSAKLGDTDGSPNRRSSSSDGAATQNAQDFFGQVPEAHWSVPELPSRQPLRSASMSSGAWSTLSSRGFGSESSVMANRVDESSASVNGGGGKDSASFECNICLELAQDPVVTLCGHLFCWPCLYEWLHVHAHTPECPVCKAVVEEEKLVPLYGRGKTSTDPRSRSVAGVQIPSRPAGQRPATAPQPDHHNHYQHPNPWFVGGGPVAGGRWGNYTFSAAIGGLFPLLNFHVHGFPQATAYGPAAGFPYGYDHSFHGWHGYGFPRQAVQGQQVDIYLKVLLVLVGVLVTASLIAF